MCKTVKTIASRSLMVSLHTAGRTKVIHGWPRAKFGTKETRTGVIEAFVNFNCDFPKSSQFQSRDVGLF